MKEMIPLFMVSILFCTYLIKDNITYKNPKEYLTYKEYIECIDDKDSTKCIVGSTNMEYIETDDMYKDTFTFNVKIGDTVYIAKAVVENEKFTHVEIMYTGYDKPVLDEQLAEDALLGYDADGYILYSR